MADVKDSTFSYITSPTGIVITVLWPDGGSPTGYSNRNIILANFLKDIQADVDAIELDVADHETRITTLENVIFRKKYPSQVSNFAYTQPANSTIKKIVARGINDSETLQVGLNAYGNTDLADFTFQTAYSLRAKKEKDYDTRASRTIYFTVGGTISVDIYIELNTV